jgi:hypothetical protein
MDSCARASCSCLLRSSLRSPNFSHASDRKAVGVWQSRFENRFGLKKSNKNRFARYLGLIFSTNWSVFHWIDFSGFWSVF